MWCRSVPDVMLATNVSDQVPSIQYSKVTVAGVGMRATGVGMRTRWGSVVLAWAAVVPPALAVILPGGDRPAGPLELLVVAAALWGIVLVTGVRGLPWPLVVITAAAWVVLAAAAAARAIEHWPAGLHVASATPAGMVVGLAYAAVYTVVIVAIGTRCRTHGRALGEGRRRVNG